MWEWNWLVLQVISFLWETAEICSDQKLSRQVIPSIRKEPWFKPLQLETVTVSSFSFLQHGWRPDLICCPGKEATPVMAPKGQRTKTEPQCSAPSGQLSAAQTCRGSVRICYNLLICCSSSSDPEIKPTAQIYRTRCFGSSGHAAAMFTAERLLASVNLGASRS